MTPALRRRIKRETERDLRRGRTLAECEETRDVALAALEHHPDAHRDERGRLDCSTKQWRSSCAEVWAHLIPHCFRVGHG